MRSISKAMLIASTAFCFHLSAFSQDISLKVNDVTVKEAMEQLKKTSGYSFVFSSNDVDTKQRISISADNATLDEVVKQILSGQQGVGYEIQGKKIIIKKIQSVQKQTGKRTKVTGKVVDAKGEPVIGATIREDGTSNGTITDFDGNFSLDVFSNSLLEVSYVGYKSQQLRADANGKLNVTLKEDTEVLDEVVVTALGIKRSEKALTYNVQEVKSDVLTTVKDANLVNSLSGKIAGVTINQSASGIGGSSRVVMRGTKSLFGDNNALYVLDGIPLTSLRTEQTTSFFENPDGGDSDGISNINPDDIESISVLTGAAAAALYGTKGANGVILLTSKKGTKGKLRVNYSNDTQFFSPFVMPEFQNTYGSESGEYASWGEKLETPSSYDPKDFFQTGYKESNSLSASVGNDRNQSYISAASTNSRGIIPNNTYEQYNFNFRNTSELIKDKLTLDVSASYIITKSKNQVSQGQYHNPLIPIYLFPRGEDINKYKVYERYNPERGFNTQYWEYGVQDLSMENPYWIINRERFENNKQRYLLSGTLKYDITKDLNVVGRLRIDNSDDVYERKLSASTDMLFASSKGNYMNQSTKFSTVYGDLIASYTKQLRDFSLNVNLGGSFTNVTQSVTGYEGHLLTVPNLFTFSNIDKSGADTKAIQSGYEEANRGLFATAQLGYKSAVFLDLSGRNDWYSTLAFTDHEKKGFFYPSIGLSGILTEFVDLSAAGISFWKIRGSFSEVGNAPARFLTNTTYGISGGVLETLPSVPATFLEPERTKSFEVGTNIRFWENRFNLDVTYYNSNTYNQFFTFTMPPSSGYKQFYLNGGKVNNWGIEASFSYSDTFFGQLHWTSGITFTMNRNEIKKLLDDDAVNPITGEKLSVDEIEPFAAQGTYKMILKEGGSMNDIYVSGLRTDNDGYIYVDPATGGIQENPNVWIKAGSAAPRFNWGWNNNLSWKGISLGFLITARIGGVGVSATQALMDRYGVSKASADARDAGGVVINGNGTVGAKDYYGVVGSGRTGVLSEYVYSATNVRLQELSLGYTFPKKMLGELFNELSVSFIGKNLFMFYKKAPFDPELSASTSTYYQGFDYFMQPSLRSLGFSVKVSL